jgi:hypothetical protein
VHSLYTRRVSRSCLASLTDKHRMGGGGGRGEGGGREGIAKIIYLKI